jgi:hypothetical protein
MQALICSVPFVMVASVEINRGVAVNYDHNKFKVLATVLQL